MKTKIQWWGQRDNFYLEEHSSTSIFEFTLKNKQWYPSECKDFTVLEISKITNCRET